MSPFLSTRRLWSLRWVLLLALIPAVIAALVVSYRVSVLPPDIAQKDRPYGLATVQIYVDQQRSALGDANALPEALAGRAPAYAELAKSSEIQQDIARRTGFAAGSFVIVSRVQSRRAGTEDPNGQTNAIPPGTPSVSLVTRAESPLITVEGQGPSAAYAQRLTDAASRSLRRFVLTLQNDQGVPTQNQIRLRQLGEARATVVRQSASPLSVAGRAIAAWLVLGLLIVAVDAFVRRSREERRIAAAARESVADAEPADA